MKREKRRVQLIKRQKLLAEVSQRTAMRGIMTPPCPGRRARRKAWHNLCRAISKISRLSNPRSTRSL